MIHPNVAATAARSLCQLAFLALFSLPAFAAPPQFPPAAQLPSRPELPDPLAMRNGDRVTTSDQWFRQRRPELKALFEHYMYGHMPPGQASFAVGRTDTNYFGGKATRKDIVVHLGAAGRPDMQLLLLVPNQRLTPAPVFLGLNFCGNHALLNDPTIPLPQSWMPSSCAGCTNNRATDAGRGTQVDTWALEQSIDRGYAVAVFYNGDVEGDRPEAPDGIRAGYRQQDWGTIAAWAWGLSRAVDYLVMDRDIDAKKIAVVGHSRNGKAAMLAAAFDERIALALPLQAGCGGTAPSRCKVGESVKQINDHFPHWFNAEFKKFNESPDRLPFDQNCLIALCAPRPVLLCNAVEDQWANPKGQFEMLQAAEPVYRLLGVPALQATEMPEIGKLLDSPLGFYIRPGKHAMSSGDWKVFLEYADKHFGKPR